MSLLEDSSYYPIIRMKFGLAFFLIPIAVSYLIGIDFGSQFIKVAYQPFNRPPEIVSDASGKRKMVTLSSLGMIFGLLEILPNLLLQQSRSMFILE